MQPIWTYLAVAAAVAAIAFVMGQFAPGMGGPFVALATSLWVAFSVARERQARRQR